MNTTNLIKRIKQLPPVLVDEIEEYVHDEVMDVRMERYRWFVIAENDIWEQMAWVRCRDEDEFVYENVFTCDCNLDMIEGFSMTHLDAETREQFITTSNFVRPQGAAVIYYKTVEYRFYNSFSSVVNHTPTPVSPHFYDEERSLPYEVGFELKSGISSDKYDRRHVGRVQVYGKKSMWEGVPNYLWTCQHGVLPGTFEGAF